MVRLIQKGSSMGRPKSNRRSVRLSVTLNEESHRAVREIAEAMDLSIAWIVRRAVSEFLERYAKKGKLPLRNSDGQAA